MRFDGIWSGETRELDDAARRSSAGQFIRLTDGYTHYEIGDPARPPSVVLIHGFSVPYFIWDPTFSALLSAGINPMRYDLYGRGYSGRPDANYGIELYLRQLRELLDALRVKASSLVGLSMGGVIAAAFTTRQPSRVRRVVLIDPTGVKAMPLRPLYRIAMLPGIGELIMALLGTEALVQGVASDFYEPSAVGAFQRRYRTQMQYRGFKRAVLSTLRSDMLGEFSGVYQDLAKLDTPLMLLWGEQDPTVPFEQSELLLRLIPRVVFNPIPACGHVPHYEKPGVTNPMLIDFLQGKNGKVIQDR